MDQGIKTMLDLQDRFINWLLSGFYENLKREGSGYGQKLAKAIEENDTDNVDLYLRMIQETRGILDDLSDENMDFKDFVGLLVEKYGAGD